MKLAGSVLAVLFFATQSLVNAGVTDEHKLHDRLFKGQDYNKLHRPVRNSSDKVNVKLGISLIRIYELDEHAEQLISHVWMRQLWRDQYLVWKPEEYGGLTTLRVPADLVWKPDLSLYNGLGKPEIHDVNAVIYNSGDVLYIPAATLVSMCQLDLRKFPFDEQTCVLKFGSWSYDGNSIDFDFYEGQEQIDLSDHFGNNAWDVVSTSARIYQMYYPCCSEPYPDVKFNITMRRKTTYYHYVFVTPAVMLALLCPVLFLLPSDDTGKFPLGGTLLITLAVLFNMLQEQLPVSHNTVPVIGVYYTVVFVLISLSLAISAVTSNIANRATRLSQPPNILKTILLSCLGRVLCVPYDSAYGVGTSDVSLQDSDGDKGKQRKGVAEWRLMAMVLDRIFFILFLIIVILTTLVLLA